MGPCFLRRAESMDETSPRSPVTLSSTALAYPGLRDLARRHAPLIWAWSTPARRAMVEPGASNPGSNRSEERLKSGRSVWLRQDFRTQTDRFRHFWTKGHDLLPIRGVRKARVKIAQECWHRHSKDDEPQSAWRGGHLVPAHRADRPAPRRSISSRPGQD